MIDRSIPFYNIILRCDRYEPMEVCLPKSYSIIPYQKGLEKSWAALEYAIGDFDSPESAENYFISNYLQDSSLFKNILFLINDKDQVIGSCIAWEDLREEEAVASVHWLVVDQKFQGQGFGKALTQTAMNLFVEQEKLPIYIHTQPWSWPAILLYLSLGFRVQKSDTFSDYTNDYEQAAKVLEGLMTPEQNKLFKAMSDD